MEIEKWIKKQRKSWKKKDSIEKGILVGSFVVVGIVYAASYTFRFLKWLMKQ